MHLLNPKWGFKKSCDCFPPQYDTDFYVLDKYPLAVRPFYTMPDPNNPVSLSPTHTHQQYTQLLAT